MADHRLGTVNTVSEWTFTSTVAYDDPPGQIEMDVLWSDPQGCTWRVPAFWAGGQEWRARFAPRAEGRYTFRSECSDARNGGLHGQTGALQATPYQGQNPLLRHGPLRVSADRRYLEHVDGEPFFWLGDLWWLGLSARLRWPEDFQALVADRAAKGFTVVQVVAGLPCDMPAFDPRGHNEAGHPWQPDYARLNPAFFDMMDLRIQWLVRQGLLPCIFGAWGFYLLWMGQRKMKQHWRYLVARYGAYPVVWSLAGSLTMPFYVSQQKEQDRERLKQEWVELARYLRALDPYGHPRVAHPFPFQPEPSAYEQEGLLDCYFPHTGMGGIQGLPRRAQLVSSLLAREPRLPVIQGEGPFEGLDGNGEEVQRMSFYISFLLGLRGLTYAANGIWQVNNEWQEGIVPPLFGPSPSGMTLGNMLWRDASRLPGSSQVGIGKRLLMRYPWWKLQYHPEWVEPHAEVGALAADPSAAQKAWLPYAAGIPAQVRIVYFPRPWWPSSVGGTEMRLRELEAAIRYRAFFYNPRTGQEHALGHVEGSVEWPVPLPPAQHDWVLVLERQG